MEMPTKEQIDEAIVESRLLGETEAELNERIDAMCRLTDDDLAKMGIHPKAPEPEPESQAPERSDAGAPRRRSSANRARSARPTTAKGASIDVTEEASAVRQHCESEPKVTQPEPASPLDFEPVRRKVRHDGWTAERQRTFIQCLAETGCVRTACAEVGLNARSAYKLREHTNAQAFRSAWDHATSLATARLTSIAFDRAINGGVERIYRNGELYEERRKPSDKLLMWLLSHHNPVDYGWLSKPPKEWTDPAFYLPQSARKEMPKLLDELADVPVEDCPVDPVAVSDLDPFGSSSEDF